MTIRTPKKERVDFRIICDCQRHRLQEQALWRRSLKLMKKNVRRVARGGMAVLIGVPIAYGLMGLPSEAMITSVSRPVAMESSASRFPIFTTPTIKKTFFEPVPDKDRPLSIEVVKEEFFRTQVPYGSIIYREARKNRLAPELVAAVVEAESDFRVRLVSEKDARGLMQIMPSTGRLLGAEDLFNPEENVAAGTKYLRYLMDRFGDSKIALAAYNAGEGNVTRFGGMPPFQETRDYVQRVASHTRWYRDRLRVTCLSASRMLPAMTD